MLWLDLIDILFLVTGLALGYIICYVHHHDIFLDECQDCLYREYFEEDIKNVGE